MTRREEQTNLVTRLTAERLAFTLLRESGEKNTADEKQFEADQAQAISDFDERHGLADVSYAEFRQAFDAGMGCAELFSLRNGMHPKDPLKVDANSDLRSVKCTSSGETRADPK